MDLTEIVAEMEKEGRLPALSISAHKKTLQALVALAKRLDRLEKASKPK